MVEIYIMEFKLDNIKNWGLKFQRCKDKLVLKNMNMLEYAVIIYPSHRFLSGLTYVFLSEKFIQ